jgi:hypothetical protein
MTEDEARQVLLLRAFEDPPTAPWSAADRDALSDEAARRLGGSAAPDRLLAERAALGVQRLVRREPGVAGALHATARPGAWVPVVLLLAFAAGLTLDGATSGARINLFAPPLLAMLAWNLAVYLLIGLGAMRTAAPSGLRAGIARLATRSAARLKGVPARFAAAWLRSSAPLQSARTAALLHGCAALLALGMVASMYARGSFFEFRAGWDSTFFDAATLHRLMGWLYGPAAALAGVALPGVDEFAALRLSAGRGEVAARWIHLMAATVGAVVVLPRAVLWTLAATRAARLSRNFPLPLDDGYFRALQTQGGAAAADVIVLPYGHRLAAGQADRLRRALEAELGKRLALQLADTVAVGDEDSLASRPAIAADAAACVALFALTATPERETHGAFLQALSARRPAGARLIVVLDETAFRQRFGDTERLAQRRGAWQTFLAELDLTPLSVDLAAVPAER